MQKNPNRSLQLTSLSHTTQFPFRRNFSKKKKIWCTYYAYLFFVWDDVHPITLCAHIPIIPDFLSRFLSLVLSALVEVHISRLTSCHVFISLYVLSPSDISSRYTYLTYRYAFLSSHFVFSFPSYYFATPTQFTALLFPSS